MKRNGLEVRKLVEDKVGGILVSYTCYVGERLAG